MRDRRDRYGNPVTTRSTEAFETYCQGLDLFLAAQSGAIEKLTEATELDPQFALARAHLARALQIIAKPNEALEQMAKAQQHAQALTGEGADQQRNHIDIMAMLVRGKSPQVFERIKAHLKSYPRDVLMLQPCCGVFGLIGFSGRTDREQENLEFMAAFRKHYTEDWWFESQYAFALCETSELAEAEKINERAFAANPANANAVHHRAHIHYEIGEFDAGREQLNQWRATYPRDALLHCHLAWHDALWALAANDLERLWQIVEADISPDVTSAPPINVMTDLVAVLFRAQLAGVQCPQGLWEKASDYAARCFPKPGISFADAHSVIAHSVIAHTNEAAHPSSTARADTASSLLDLQNATRGWASDSVAALTHAFSAFLNQDWGECLGKLEPAMTNHERLGGSRAQRDLLELTRATVQLRLGQQPESPRVQRFL